MKLFKPTKHAFSLLLALTLVIPTSFAQCPFTFTYLGSGTAPSPGNSSTIFTCNFFGEAATANGVVVGDQYTVNVTYAVSPPGVPLVPYVVVYDASLGIVTSGASPLTFTANSPGPYYTIPFADMFCSTFDPNSITPSGPGCMSTVWSNITPVPPPANDLPCAAIPLTPGTTCNYTTYTNANATAAPGVPTPGCAGYIGGDVWFSLVVPASGNVLIDTQIGTVFDGGMAIYSGTCGSLTLIECDDDDSPNGAMPSIDIVGGTPGQTLYVRMWEVGNNNNGTFGICAVESSQCGTPLSNDYCESPTPLFQGLTNFSSSTPANYTADVPGNLSTTYCGSIENNSWFSFTALSTTEIFNFISVANCASNQGIQAAVYEVFADTNGCCNVLNLMSNCYSPSTPTTGIVTATPLVIGNQYILIVDGFSGDACDFIIANWTDNPLPVELSDFYAASLTEYNALRWETNSEKDNDYFTILRSYDGLSFSPIAQVGGAGNSQEVNSYQFDDSDIRSGLVYYQLEQVDFNGDSEKSDIIALDRKSTHGGLIAAYPNPTSGEITAEVNGDGGRNGLITVTNVNGTLIKQKFIYSKDLEKHVFDLKNCEAGIYFVRYQDDHSDQTIKLVKQ